MTLRAPAGRSATRTKTCVSSGDSIRSAGALPILQLERRQLVLLGLLVRLLLLFLLLAHRLEQLLLLVADELLAVGQARLGAPRRDVGQLLHDRAGRRRSGTRNRLPSRT